MKIISSVTKLVYDLADNLRLSETAMACPECSKDRKHKNRKSFSWNGAKQTGFCQNCQAAFMEFKPFQTKKEYKLPEWKNKTELTSKSVKWFEGRAISQEVLNQLRVYSDTEFMPQYSKDCEVICFPYFRENKLINIKFRGPEKSFKMVKEAELIWYNYDALLKYNEIIIVEGEIDCLSFIRAGVLNCISVPNGASGKNLEYLDSSIDLFERLERVFLATDNDLPGISLREELTRRIGQEKCLVIDFKDCKDANEYIQKYGCPDLASLLKSAHDIPIDGILDISLSYDSCHKLWIEGMKPGLGIDIKTIDDIVTWEAGRVSVWTGIPGHGKSEYVDFINVRMNLLHGWKVAYFSPENWPVDYHISKLSEKLSGKSFNSKFMSREMFDVCFNYIEENFFFIYPEQSFKIENILEKARYLVKKYGIKVLVIDPWNKIEHKRDKGESETDYISRCLDLLSMFAKKNNILIHVIAHPTKMQKLPDNTYQVPNAYDINGSANWYNKPDYVAVVYRDFTNNKVKFIQYKVKFKNLGKPGEVELSYNAVNGRYENFMLNSDQWDYKSWLQVNENIDLNKAFEPNYNFEEKTEIPF